MSRLYKYLPLSIMLIVMVCFVVDSVGSMAIFSRFLPYRGRQIQIVAFGSIIGFLVGQGMLAASWLSLGPGPLYIRLPASLAIVSLVILSWFIGARVSKNMSNLVVSGFSVAFCLILFVMATASFYIVRLISRRQIVAQDSPGDFQVRKQFSLRYVFIATACVAVLVTLAKFTFGAIPESGGPSARWGTVISLLYVIVAVGADTNLVALPLLWLILGDSRRRMTWVVIVAGTIVLGPFVVSELFFAVPGVGRPPTRLYWWVMAAMLIFGFAVASVTASGFWASRLIGLRFVRGVPRSQCVPGPSEL